MLDPQLMLMYWSQCGSLAAARSLSKVVFLLQVTRESLSVLQVKRESISGTTSDTYASERAMKSINHYHHSTKLYRKEYLSLTNAHPGGI